MTDTIYLFRHGERTDFVDRTWVVTAERPWDPPLTARGHEQGTKAGERLAKLGVQVARIYTSPLQRTVETADRIAAALGIDSICVEEGLAEVLDAEWYECWQCAKDSPNGARPAHELLQSPAELKASVSPRVDLSYQSTFFFSAPGRASVTLADPEVRAQLEDRLGRTAERLSERHPGEAIVLVSHGGPIEAVTRVLDRSVNAHRMPMCWYTGLSVFERARTAGGAGAEAPGPWQCCVYGDASHAGGKRGFHRPGSATALRFAPALPALGGDEEAGGARQNAPAASAAQGEEEEAFFGGLTPAPACVVE